jgi:hypothetical protein
MAALRWDGQREAEGWNMRKTAKRTLAAAIVFLGAMTTADLCLALTEQQEAADCQDDAMRLCGPYIPDHAKIHACLVTYKAYLSPACRAIVAPAKGRKH